MGQSGQPEGWNQQLRRDVGMWIADKPISSATASVNL